MHDIKLHVKIVLTLYRNSETKEVYKMTCMPSLFLIPYIFAFELIVLFSIYGYSEILPFGGSRLKSHGLHNEKIITWKELENHLVRLFTHSFQGDLYLGY